MVRRWRKVLRRGTALMLAAAVFLNGFGMAAASGMGETGPPINEEAFIGEMISTMQTMVAETTVSEAETLAVAASGTAPSWNLLSKAVGNFYLYDERYQDIRVSGDGRYIAFQRQDYDSSSIGKEVMTVFDRVTGETDQIAVPADQEYEYGIIMDFDMSSDARYVVFSYGVNIYESLAYIYLFDRETRQLTQITPEEGLPGLHDSNAVSISADGRYIAFDFDLDGLVPADQNGSRDVYVYDRETGEIEWISTKEGISDDYGESAAPSISADGRYIVFHSERRFTGDDPLRLKDIYLYDREAEGERFQLISQGINGTASDGYSEYPLISADSQVIAFESDAENLVADDPNEMTDIFVYDRRTNETKLVSVSPGGSALTRRSFLSSISEDGRYVGFHLEKRWGDIGEDDLPEEAFIADVAARTTSRVEVPGASYRLLQPSNAPAVALNGKLVAFQSNYIHTFMDWEYEYSGVFVATQGEAPTWPTGSDLQASNESPQSVTLRWQDATDAKGILGYHVYQDDEIVGYVPFGSAGGNTFTASGWYPGALPLFRVEAVNIDYNESSGGPSYRLQDGGDPADELTVIWSAEKTLYRELVPEGSLTVSAYGAPDKHIAAELTYKVWTDDTTQETRSTQLVLTETEDSGDTSGYSEYTAEWPLPEGLIGIDALTVELTDPTEPSEPPLTASAEGFPVKTAGTIVVEFDNPYGMDLTEAIMYSQKSRSGIQWDVLDSSDSFSIHVSPDRDYSFRLYSADYSKNMGTIDQVQVEAGKTKTVRMAVIAPAELRLRFVDQYGKPVDDVEVDLFDTEENFITMFYSDLLGWTERFDELHAGQTVVAKVSVGKELFEPVPNEEFVLGPGQNERVIELQGPRKGTLEGFVLRPDGQTVTNAQISVKQFYQGRNIVSRAMSNLEGAYRLDLLAGEAQIDVFESSNYYQTEEAISVQITEGAVTKLNIPVAQPDRGILDVEVRVKSIEDSEFSEPLNLERANFFTSLSTFSGHMSGYMQNSYNFAGRPGERVTVCVSGSTPTIPAGLFGCTTVTLDENSNATAQLYLEEKGGRITGTFAQTDHVWISGDLYKINDSKREFVASYGGDRLRADEPFEIPVSESGSYILRFTRMIGVSPVEYEYANVGFTIGDKQILSVGTVSFDSKKVFKSQNQNFYTALKNRVVPGGTITLRAGYEATDADATDVSLMFDIPEGMTPVTDSAGQIVISEMEPSGEVLFNGTTLTVPVGNLTKDKPGFIRFQLKVDPAFNAPSAGTSAHIRAIVGSEQVDETLGSIVLDAPVITLAAPKRVSTASISVSGVAPPASTVQVYGGKALLGSTTASATGYWEQRVELPDLGDPGVHALHAETEASGVKLFSETVYVDYDTKSPRLLEMAIAQAPNGKWVMLDVGNEVPRSPYSVRPGNPFQFELKFDRPDDVENVSVYLGGQPGDPIKAVREGGLYRALVPTGRDALGGIYVDYDVKEEPFVADETIPSIDQIRGEMPPGMKDFEFVVTEPFEFRDGVYSGTVEMTFPGLEDMTTTVTLTIDPNDEYLPTAEELEEAVRTGLPMYNGSFGVTETEDELITSVKGYLPLSVLFPDGLPEEMNEMNALASFETKDIGDKAVSMSLKAYTKAGLPMGKEISAVKGQYDMLDKFSQKVNRIMSQAQSAGARCYQNIPRTVNQAGKALAAAVGGEVAKYALKGWVGAMALSGPGAAVAGVASKIVSKQIDNYVERQIQEVGTGYNECKEEDRRYRLPDDEDWRWRKVADPNWIYDPSGYVYEAVPENRLNDVQATVLYQNPDSLEWVVWEAEPFEQINPHYTDDQGQYGWDVPPGKWKVVWEKEGYERQESAELEVPPPHTEVHAGLVSLEAPAVNSVAGMTGSNGGYVDVEFTKYLRVSELPVNAVIVTETDGTEIKGTVAFVEPADNPADPDGADLSRVVRFTPQIAMTVGKSYVLRVNASDFQSYAGVWMTEGYTGDFTVVEKDERGPQAVSATEEAGGMIVRLVFDEPVNSEFDVSKFVLNGSADLVVSAVKSVAAGDESAILLTLSEPLIAGTVNELVLQEGVATDASGNASAPATLAIDAAPAPSDNALLESLQVAEGDLSPSFDPAAFVYTVNVSASAEELHVVAATADPKAKLSIGGMVALNKTPRAVHIPDDGEIAVLVTAEDGKTMRSYTIQVVRVAGKDASLSGLTVAPGAMAPAFDPASMTYSVEVAPEVAALQVTATANDSRAKSITINGATAESGVSQTVPVPEDGLITVAVTAEDGVTVQMYQIQVIRVAGKDASLSGLTVAPGVMTPEFDPATAAYNVEVDADVGVVQVIATANDPRAKSITMNGAAAESGVEQTVDLPEDGSITIAVTAEDGTTVQTYNIQVIRKPAPVEVNVALTVSAYELQTTEPVTVTASVYGHSGVPTGTLTFFDGTTPLSTVSLKSDGTASYRTTSLQAGTYDIIAVYNGDAAYPTKQSNVVVVTFVATQPGPVLNYTMEPSYSTTPRGVRYVSGFTLTLTPPSGMMELPSTVYRLNGQGDWHTYTAPFSFGVDVKKVEYQSTDSQGVTGPTVFLDFMKGVILKILGN